MGISRFPDHQGTDETDVNIWTAVHAHVTEALPDPQLALDAALSSSRHRRLHARWVLPLAAAVVVAVITIATVRAVGAHHGAQPVTGSTAALDRAQLTGTWRIDQIQLPSEAPVTGAARLVLDPAFVSISGACISISGRWSLSGSDLTVTDLSRSQVGCGGLNGEAAARDAALKEAVQAFVDDAEDQPLSVAVDGSTMRATTTSGIRVSAHRQAFTTTAPPRTSVPMSSTGTSQQEVVVRSTAPMPDPSAVPEPDADHVSDPFTALLPSDGWTVNPPTSPAAISRSRAIAVARATGSHGEAWGQGVDPVVAAVSLTLPTGGYGADPVVNRTAVIVQLSPVTLSGYSSPSRTTTSLTRRSTLQVAIDATTGRYLGARSFPASN